MERGGQIYEKDQASVNLSGTGLEEPIRKDKEEFTVEGRITD